MGSRSGPVLATAATIEGEGKGKGLGFKPLFEEKIPLLVLFTLAEVECPQGTAGLSSRVDPTFQAWLPAHFSAVCPQSSQDREFPSPELGHGLVRGRHFNAGTIPDGKLGLLCF